MTTEESKSEAVGAMAKMSDANCAKCEKLYHGEAASVLSLLCELGHGIPKHLQQGLVQEGWVHSLADRQERLI